MLLWNSVDMLEKGKLMKVTIKGSKPTKMGEATVNVPVITFDSWVARPPEKPVEKPVEKDAIEELLSDDDLEDEIDWGQMSDISEKMQEVATHFWGEPTSKSQTELRWGNHGSKSVNLSQGTWYDFENAEGGGVVDLVKKEMPSLNGSIQGFLDTFLDTPKQTNKKSTKYEYTCL